MYDITQAEFVTSVFRLEQLPEDTIPEVAFAGKSNVGKSSLLNRLVNRKGLVKTSSRPGFTQSLNFFLVNRDAYFVDLPGYGFARAPKDVKRKWYALVEGYLKKRSQLKLVVSILDIRRRPDRLDLDLIDYLKAVNIPFIVVLNKADKLSQPKRMRHIKVITDLLPQSMGFPVLVLSAKSGEGVPGLRKILFEALGVLTP